MFASTSSSGSSSTECLSARSNCSAPDEAGWDALDAATSSGGAPQRPEPSSSSAPHRAHESRHVGSGDTAGADGGHETHSQRLFSRAVAERLEAARALQELTRRQGAPAADALAHSDLTAFTLPAPRNNGSAAAASAALARERLAPSPAAAPSVFTRLVSAGVSDDASSADSALVSSVLQTGSYTVMARAALESPHASHHLARHSLCVARTVPAPLLPPRGSSSDMVRHTHPGREPHWLGHADARPHARRRHKPSSTPGRSSGEWGVPRSSFSSDLSPVREDGPMRDDAVPSRGLGWPAGGPSPRPSSQAARQRSFVVADAAPGQLDRDSQRALASARGIVDEWLDQHPMRISTSLRPSSELFCALAPPTPLEARSPKEVTSSGTLPACDRTQRDAPLVVSPDLLSYLDDNSITARDIMGYGPGSHLPDESPSPASPPPVFKVPAAEAASTSSVMFSTQSAWGRIAAPGEPRGSDDLCCGSSAGSGAARRSSLHAPGAPGANVLAVAEAEGTDASTLVHTDPHVRAALQDPPPSTAASPGFPYQVHMSGAVPMSVAWQPARAVVGPSHALRDGVTSTCAASSMSRSSEGSEVIVLRERVRQLEIELAASAAARQALEAELMAARGMQEAMHATCQQYQETLQRSLEELNDSQRQVDELTRALAARDGSGDADSLAAQGEDAEECDTGVGAATHLAGLLLGPSDEKTADEPIESLERAKQVIQSLTTHNARLHREVSVLKRAAAQPVPA